MKENDGEKSGALTHDIVSKAFEITRNKKLCEERKALNINNNFAIWNAFHNTKIWKIKGGKKSQPDLFKPSPPHDAGWEDRVRRRISSRDLEISLLRHSPDPGTATPDGDTQAASGNIGAFLFPQDPASA